MLFLLKQTLKAMIMPLPALILVGFIGLFLIWADRRPRLGKALVAGVLSLLLLLSVAPIVGWMGESLEREYPAYSGAPVEFIVVLGGGHVSDPDLPITSWLGSQSLYRVVEGIRLAHLNPDALLAFSGYGGTDSLSAAVVNRSLATSLGVDPSRIYVFPWPTDTRQEAEAIAPLVRDRPFALVTSATHMPRAMAIFRSQGMDPIPAPAGHMIRSDGDTEFLEVIPSSQNLRTSRQLWYEFLGSIWEAVRPSGS